MQIKQIKLNVVACLLVALTQSACGETSVAEHDKPNVAARQRAVDPSAMRGMFGVEYNYISERSPVQLAQRVPVVVRGSILDYQRRGVVSYSSAPGTLDVVTMRVLVSEVLEGELPTAVEDTVNVDFLSSPDLSELSAATPDSAETVLYLVAASDTPNATLPGSEFEQDENYSASGPTFKIWSPQAFLVEDSRDDSVVLPMADSEFSDTSLEDVEPDETSAFPPEDHTAG